MVTTRFKKYDSNILRLHSLIQSEPGFKECCNKDLRDYFNYFEKNAEMVYLKNRRALICSSTQESKHYS